MQVFVGHAIDQGAAMVVHQRFGQAGGATGIHNPQRVVERHPQRGKGLHLRVIALHDLRPIGGVGHGRQAAQVLVNDHMLHAGQRGAQLAHHAQAHQVFATIGDAIHTDQDLGRDLLETINDRVGAHVGRAHTPNTADAGDRQKRHHGLRDVGQVGRDPVSRLHTLGLQMQGQCRHLSLQLGPRQLTPLAAFVVADDGRHARRMRCVDMAQHLLGVVHLSPDKPTRTRHDIALKHHAVRRGRLQTKVIPHRLPKIFQVRDRPLPQGGVIVEMQLTVFGQPLLVEPHLRHKRRVGVGCVHGVRGYQPSPVV